MAHASTARCYPRIPAIVSGYSELRLCHPEVCAHSVWVDAPTVIVEFPLAGIPLDAFVLIVPSWIADLNWHYALRDGPRRYFLSGGKPLYRAQTISGNAILEVWNKEGAPEDLTLLKTCFVLTAYKRCADASRELTARVNKALWFALCPQGEGPYAEPPDNLQLRFTIEDPC